MRRPRKGEVSTWDQMEEAPRADLPDGQGIARRTRWLSWVAIAAMVMMPLVALIAASNMLTPTQVTVVKGGDNSNQAVRSAAQIAVERWLALEPSPLPGGYVVTWDGAKNLAAAPAAQGEKSQYRLQAHTFTLATKSEDSRMFTATALMALSPSGGASAVGEPSLLPTAPLNDPELSTAARWPGLPSANISEETTKAVTAWARAYTSGDSQALRLVVNDPDPKHTYLPLVGSLLDAVEVNDAAGVWPAGHPTKEEENLNKQPSTLLVSVTLRLAWPVDGEDPESGPALPAISYDVLVTGADTASPRVVAWSGPGLGVGLKPLVNAVKTTTTVTSGLDDQAGSQPEASPSTSPETSPTPKPKPKPKNKPKKGR